MMEIYLKIGKERIRLEGEEWLDFINYIKEDA